jgi:hypothetical protein
MAYDPGAHERLVALSMKYGDWYRSQVNRAHDDGQPVLNADGIESNLFRCYEDALVTAHALSAYLAENPCQERETPRPEPFLHPPPPPPVGVLDPALAVVAREQTQGDSIRRLRRRRPWRTRVAAKDLAGHGPGRQFSA